MRKGVLIITVTHYNTIYVVITDVSVIPTYIYEAVRKNKPVVRMLLIGGTSHFNHRGRGDK